MKVLWVNNKSQEVCGNKIKTAVTPSDSQSNLSKVQTYPQLRVTINEKQVMPKLRHPQTNHRPHTGEKRKEVRLGYGDEAKPACKVCGSYNELRAIRDSASLFQNCFGVQVLDLTAKICDHCAELILHTNRFRDMVCTAFQPIISEDESISDADSNMSVETKIKQNPNGSEERFLKKINPKKKPRKEDKSIVKKTIVMCTVCRQKYPMMMSQTNNFVCCRCKITRDTDRSVACVKCKAVMPSGKMRDHLALHAKMDLRGRCRLRSLPKKPSKAQTTASADPPRKLQKQMALYCTRCRQLFSLPRYLEAHMRKTHGEYCSFICLICGNDLRSKTYLDKHMKSHQPSEYFECKKCGKIFKSSMAMKRHVLIHEGQLQS